MRGKRVGALMLVAAGAVYGETPLDGPLRVTAVRHWSMESVTRIAIEVSGDFEYHTERLHNPDRIFFDILDARPSFEGKRARHERVGDRRVTRVRIAEPVPGVTRVVLDLASPVVFAASRIGNPNRLMIELRPAPVEEPAPSPAPSPSPTMEAAPVSAPTARRQLEPPAPRKPLEPAAAISLPAPPAALPPPAPAVKSALPVAATAPPAPPVAGAGTAATHKSDGTNSLIRALGLKINRVVIDPGHGGHDQGTVGRRGLLEKELVLDLSRRLGGLMQQQIGCEVVYTRTDDAFVPLEGRTALANEKKADLFISLHANSSAYPRIAGVETFYLNFTTSRDALDVAGRENASSQKPISELQDLLQKIAQQEKIDESKELAARIQSTLFSFSSRYNPGIRNRGVKKAPFVVLLGAQMPSVLVEVGFLSNSREEALLKRPDHRQRLAEALLRGVTRYTQSLSHFQMARTQE